jgi:predicted Zn-dependent protease
MPVRRASALLSLTMALAACAPDLALPEVSQFDVAAEQMRLDTLLSEQGEARPQSPIVDAAVKDQAQEIKVRLQDAALPLCAKIKHHCFFDLQIAEARTVNAYASGANRVTLYGGLVNLLKYEDGVAFVIAHEMGHHLAQHLTEDAINTRIGGAVGGALAGVLAAALGADIWTQADIVETGSELGEYVGVRVYSQAQEKEADYLANYLLARAGYDIKSGLRVIDALARDTGDTVSRAHVLATHPSNPDRAASQRATMAEIEQLRASGRELLPKPR